MVSSELVLLTLVGRTFRLCRPSTCALIIADSILLVKGFLKIFLPFSFLLFPGSPSGLSRPDSRALGLDPSPFYRGTAARHSSVAAPRRFVYRPSEPSRPARVVTRSRWNHPLSMVLFYHTSAGLSRVFEDFFRGSSNLVLGYKSAGRLVLRHLASPCSALCGRPSEGLGSASPPDNDIISPLYYQYN